MGKWDRRNYARTRRRNYQDYHWSPPRDEPCPDPETEDWQDNVPMWEKKFCYLVGRIPWKKVLSTKNFMHGPSNVLSWDDSAGKEAFNDTKKRFWHEINGLPFDTQHPDPDMYIDETNWNPSIDPELVKELDKAYFNPDDRYYLPSAPSSRRNNEWPEDTGKAWEHCPQQGCTIKDKVAGSNPWDDSVNDTSILTKNNDPWEGHHTQKSEIVKDNAWEGAWNKSWDSKHNNHSDVSNNWLVESNKWRSEGTGWRDHGSCSRNFNHNSGGLVKPSNLNSNHRTQMFGRHQESRMSDGRGILGGQPRRDTSNFEVKESGNVYRGQGWHGTSCRKREGPDHHAVMYKGPRLQDSNYQTPRHWGTNNNKRDSFGSQWS